MRCDQLETRLDAYIDGEMPAEEIAFLETHLDGCSACRRELAQRRELRRVYSDQPRTTAPPGLQQRILAAADAEQTADRTGGQAERPGLDRLRRARWPLALAAAASLTLVVMLPSLREQTTRDDPGIPFSTPAQVVVPRFGEQAGQATPVNFGGLDLGGTSERSSE